MASCEDYYHSIQMSGPWYEQDGPTQNEAFHLIKTHCEIKNIFMPDWVIKNKINTQITAFGGLGSWRGFHTFTLSGIIEGCLNWHKTIYIPAIKTLAKSKIMHNWINHVLYRYPDEKSNEKIGLRVHFHKQKFDKMVHDIQSSSNNSSSSKSDSSVSE